MDPKGRILAIDYGRKNIGLACSDALRLTVRPLPSIINSGPEKLIRKLRTLVCDMDIRELVMGIPLNMDGSGGGSVDNMKRLMRVLNARLRVPLTGVDERLSTVEAMDYWRKMSPRQQKRYRTADSLAAALILERYLKEH